MNALTHQLWDFSRIFGLRDRLRCPRCYAVGTWKPHGGWLDDEDERKVRRWLCKWCGHYIGPEGVKQAHLGEKVWQLGMPELHWPMDLLPFDDMPVTPITTCTKAFGRQVNPWAG